MEKTIEQKVAAAVLEKDVATIEVAGETYRVAPPTIATLIMVSEAVSTLPVVHPSKDASDIVASVLHHAKDFRALGDIAAILILGAKKASETVEGWKTETVGTRFFGLVKRRRKTRYRYSQRERLAEIILDNVRPSVLWDLIVKRLNMHEIGDFFAITTSLSEANLLRPTRGVEEAETASGRR